MLTLSTAQRFYLMLRRNLEEVGTTLVTSVVLDVEGRVADLISNLSPIRDTLSAIDGQISQYEGVVFLHSFRV